ncbi:MAG: hypothetical protein RL122_125 [Pseudomonadota bacterium]|jgi:integral membrane protein (TIGR01906 family)|uniref:DUF1461 domain-containing protein n=1 Tax=Thiothrix fructosivorans TaxID=111770 RepID=A0A8B0SKA7_9GAMM|nr:DUF1461 domain-containing protein [Thiothrix fructosivorans]MBO0613112.1 DUF1461 domain-containing protein [Thiothrix fructosivorans]QTX11445.1 DUF1461 domain-containing protein [Thiothrix fructosivorans]
MAKLERTLARQLSAAVLLGLTSIGWVLVLYLGEWVVLLHIYAGAGDAVVLRQEIVAYLLGAGAESLPSMNALNLAEARHLLDVRRLFAALETLFYGVLAVSVLLLVLQRHFAAGRMWLLTSYVGLISILLLGLLIALGGFVPLFVWLHSVVFPAGTWVFPDNSVLIQLFPLAYFLRFGVLYTAALVLIFTGLLIGNHRRSR